MEDLIYGKEAVRALFKLRRQDIRKIYIISDLTKDFKELLIWARAQKLAYKVVDEEDLHKITRAIHHQGVAVYATALRYPELNTLLSNDTPGPILALYGVNNPHNLGAIMRTAAFFGTKAMIQVQSSNVKEVPLRLQGALARVSEGAMEYVPLYFLTLEKLLQLSMEYDWTIYATTPHQGPNLFMAPVGKKSIFLLGAEGSGLKMETLKKVKNKLSIPGANQIESLNVGQAATVFLARWAQLWVGK